MAFMWSKWTSLCILICSLRKLDCCNMLFGHFFNLYFAIVWKWTTLWIFCFLKFYSYFRIIENVFIFHQESTHNGYLCYIETVLFLTCPWKTTQSTLLQKVSSTLLKYCDSKNVVRNFYLISLVFDLEIILIFHPHYHPHSGNTSRPVNLAVVRWLVSYEDENEYDNDNGNEIEV